MEEYYLKVYKCKYSASRIEMSFEGGNQIKSRYQHREVRK